MTSDRYRLEGLAPAGPEQVRVLAYDTVEDRPVELHGLKHHVWMRPGAREGFAPRPVSPPVGVEVLGQVEHERRPVLVRPRLARSFRGLRLSADEALAVLRWLGPALEGSPFRGRLTADDVWLDLDGHPRLMGVSYPEDVRLQPPATEAPEVGAGVVSPTSDLYALGAIVYEAVSGIPPARPPVDLAHVSAVPAPVAEAIMRALAPDPAARAVGLGSPDVAAPDTTPPDAAPPVIALPAAASPAAAKATSAGPPALPRERWGAAVLVDLPKLDPASRARLAVLTGVPRVAVDRAWQRDLPFVAGAFADPAEAARMSGRLERRGLPVRTEDTRTPPIVQWGAVSLFAAALGVASSGDVRYGFAALAALLFGVTASRMGRGLAKARLGVAIMDRLQAGFSDDAAGEAAQVRALLLRGNVASPVRVTVLEQLDAAVDDLADLAAAEVVNPGGTAAAELRAAEAEVTRITADARARLAEGERGM